MLKKKKKKTHTVYSIHHHGHPHVEPSVCPDEFYVTRWDLTAFKSKTTLGLGRHPRLSTQWNSEIKYGVSGNIADGRKDIVYESPDELAVVGVVGDPDVVFAGVHAELQVGLAEAPPWSAVVLQRAHDGVD